MKHFLRDSLCIWGVGGVPFCIRKTILISFPTFSYSLVSLLFFYFRNLVNGEGQAPPPCVYAIGLHDYLRP